MRRKNMKESLVRIALIPALLLTGILVSTVHGGDGGNPEQERNDQGYWEITKADITLQWKVAETELEIILSAPTDGWVAVGFDPSNRMRGANFILGKVEDGRLVVRDDFGSGPTVHVRDSRQDVTSIDGTEQGGKTTVRFSIPLDSGDSQDKPLVQGRSYTVLLAYGRNDSFNQRHATRTSVTITLE
jgi:hypothetical protein